jgi:hypothetical protein
VRNARKVPKRPDPTARRFEKTRDEAHLERVRQMTCAIRGKTTRVTRWRGVYPDRKQITEEYQHVCSGPVAAHHVENKARGGHDHQTVPLCTAAHDELHYCGEKTFAAKWGVSLELEAEKLSRLAPKEEQT